MIFGISGWIISFLLMKQRNVEMRSFAKLSKRIVHKAVDDLGFKFYVDNNTGYESSVNNILDKVTFTLVPDKKD